MKKIYSLTVLLFCLLIQLNSLAQCDVTLSNPTPCAEESITFSVDSPFGSYAWDFDGDGFIDIFGSTVNYSFPESNIDLNYSVVLYQNGIECNTIDVLVAGLPDPTLGVIPGSGVLEGNLIRVCSGSPNIDLEIYNASTTYANNASYEINWGDGITETYDNSTFPNTSTISHEYFTYGYFNIILTVTGINGCSNTTFYTLYNGSNPSVGLANPGNTVGICAPATIDFPITNTGSNPTGTIYTLYVSGEVVALYTQENVPAVFSYTFEESSCGEATGTGNYQNAYDVQILASNPCGSSQATIEPIELSSPPEVTFASDSPATGCEDQTYTFTNTSSNLAEVIAGTCTNLTPSWTITPGVPGVHWIITGGNPLAADEIEVIFLIPGDYEIAMTVNSPSCGSGTYSNAITIADSPDASGTASLVTASVPATSDDCSPSMGILTNTSTGDSLSFEWAISPSTGWAFVDTFSFLAENPEVLFTEPGEYIIQLTASNFCASDTWDTLLVVADVPEVDIPTIPNQCGSATFDFDPSMVDINANFGVLSSVVWSFPGATPSSSTATYPTNIHYPNPGNYTIEVTIANQCGTHTATQNFVIETPGTISVDPDDEVCENEMPFVVNGLPIGGTWSGPGIDGAGMFTPADASIGSNTLVYTFQDSACVLMDSLEITINPLPVIDAGTNQEACVDASPFMINGGTPVGGTWSVDNGGVISGGNMFEPTLSGSGIFNLTYSYTDTEGCENTATKQIEIQALPVVDAGEDQELCENPFDVELTGATPLGGSWSGPGVTIDGVSFNATTAGIGDHILYYAYTDSNGCFNVDSIEMSVLPNQVSDAGADESICLNETPFVISSGTPAGGYWTGPGVDSLTNIFNPMMAGIGTHEVFYYVGTGVCQTDDSKLITVSAIPTLTVPAPQLLCINELPYDLSAATPSGGAWTGPGINGNEFDPAIAGVGIHAITYTYTDPNNNCPNSETVNMEVVPLPVILANDTTYCSTPGLVDLPAVDPIGGIWSGVGVVGNQFDPLAAGGAGNYTVIYTYSDGNNCENSESILVTVIAPADINAGDDFEICISEGSVDLSPAASPVGGTWNANGSQGLVGSVFDLELAGVGTHTLTYTVGSGNCQVFDDIQIVINPLPIVTTMADFAVCSSESAVPLTANPPGGTWTANNGAILIGNVLDAVSSGAGIYSLTYNYIDGNGCENNDDLLVEIYSLPTIVTTDTTFCNTPGIVTLPTAFPLGGNWSGPGVNADQFNPQGAGGIGTYELTYAYIDASGCSNSGTATITVIEPEAIEAGAVDTLCIDQGNFQLTGFIPSGGGIWSGPGVVNGATGIIDPALAGAGLHELIYTYGVGNCQVQDTKNILVIDLDVEAGPDLSSCFTYNPFLLEGYYPSGGVWSGTGIVDADNGVFDPELAGAGTYTLTYTYTDPVSGCSRSDQRSIVVHPMEPADFNAPILACRNEPVQFENLSPSNYNMTWQFGIGQGSSNQINPVYTYDVVGTFTVTLQVENEFGCIDEISREITIGDIPIALFNPNVSAGCSGTGFTFSNQSFGDSLSYLWEFGDFYTSTEENPGTIFFEQGLYDTTYVVSLTVTNICGSATYQDVVLVHPLPQADFGTVPLTECSPLLVDFANASTGSDLEYFWDFGNGQISTEQFPSTQTYFTDSLFSVYEITMIASNQCGADTSIAEVLVESANVQAVAEASVESGCAPLTVYFYNYSTPIATIDWDFGDGNTSATSEPTHTFTEPGEYTVIQYANSDCGYDTTAINITVYPSPIVSFGHPDQVCSGQLIEFVNASQNTSGHFWDFGDGNSSTLNNPTHTYSEPGDYTVTLVGISAANQCEAAYTSTVTVLELPTASFEPSVTYGCAPLLVDFDNNSTNALFYQWDFGDGNGSVDANPTHVFENEGTYQVTMTAIDANGCFEDFVVYNIIVTPRPVSDFEFEKNQACGLPATITFENLSEGAGEYIWTFGDGGASPFTNPSHTYTEAGTYEVVLVATNQFSCNDTTIVSIDIYDIPNAAVEIEGMDGCSPLEVQFNNTSTASVDYFWDFGDGSTSTESDPVHTYTVPGDYQVQLIASINDACYDTLQLNELIQVHTNPIANFEAFNPGEDDGTYELTNLSTNADTYIWEFSDGTTSTSVNPTHRFLNNGVQQIYLEAINEFGCVDDTIMTFTPDFVKGLHLPNAFSPEQGIGDVRLFKPSGIGLKEFHVQVFSTYGQLLWESTALDDQGRPVEAWDGTYGGKTMPQDVYVWKCSGIFEDGSSWIGVKDKRGNLKKMGSLVLLR